MGQSCTITKHYHRLRHNRGYEEFAGKMGGLINTVAQLRWRIGLKAWSTAEVGEDGI